MYRRDPCLFQQLNCTSDRASQPDPCCPPFPSCLLLCSHLLHPSLVSPSASALYTVSFSRNSDNAFFIQSMLHAQVCTEYPANYSYLAANTLDKCTVIFGHVVPGPVDYAPIGIDKSTTPTASSLLLPLHHRLLSLRKRRIRQRHARPPVSTSSNSASRMMTN